MMLIVFKLSAQDDLIVSHSRFMQKSNPSFMGLNNMNKTGVLYNSIGLVSNQGIESRYFLELFRLTQTIFHLELTCIPIQWIMLDWFIQNLH